MPETLNQLLEVRYEIAQVVLPSLKWGTTPKSKKYR